MLGVRRMAVMLALALVGCGSNSSVCRPDAELDRDPGPAIEADVVGLLGVGSPAAPPPVLTSGTGEEQARGGRSSRPGAVGGHPIRVVASTARLGGDCSAGPCLGLVTLGADGVTAERLLVLGPSDPTTVSLNTVVYRFEEGQVVLPGGFTLDLADDIVAECGAEAVSLDELADASFGVTIDVDIDQRTVVRAGCNGCE